MSLYNLIPSCKFCNSSLKGAKEFDLNDIHPYEESMGDHFNFLFEIFNKSIKIDMTKSDNQDSIKKYISLFKIDPLYNYHNNQGNELIKKREIYPDSYISELLQQYPHLFTNEAQVKELIFGYLSDEKNINDEVFLKFRRDIAIQIGVLEEKLDQRKINQLKKIIKS